MENKTKRRLFVILEESLNKTYAKKKGLKESDSLSKERILEKQGKEPPAREKES